ncbi:MAG: twin-arginine translocase TatA/TatE family subunit [Candidatus Omnitrophica bacterium]|nr:twin-arginine translocase TatA/TatE family subunit [Candidatus Omnitrophota bacterium]
MPGPFELIVIFFVILLLFGAKRLPEIGRSLGKSLRDFKNALQGLDSDDKEKKDKGGQNPPA